MEELLKKLRSIDPRDAGYASKPAKDAADLIEKLASALRECDRLAVEKSGGTLSKIRRAVSVALGDD